MTDHIATLKSELHADLDRLQVEMLAASTLAERRRLMEIATQFSVAATKAADLSLALLEHGDTTMSPAHQADIAADVLAARKQLQVLS